VIDQKLISEAARYPTATLHEAAGGIGALPSAIKPIWSGSLCGRALTIDCAPGDNLWIHRALANAREGDVLVCNVGGAHEHGYWGEILTVAAQQRGVAGLVIDGCVRDAQQIEHLRFPVFARGLCIRGTSKQADAPGSWGEPIRLGAIKIETGDLIVGDRDGLVAIPAGSVVRVLTASAAREAKEAQIMDRLKKGETTLAVYGWK
jgi:4-hydroxy-4-methyl-2-oxoglutarate aldolase